MRSERLLRHIEQQASPELSEQIGRALQDGEQQRPARRADRLCRAAGHGDRHLHAGRPLLQSHLAVADDANREVGTAWAWRLAFQRFKALLMLLGGRCVRDRRHGGVARLVGGAADDAARRSATCRTSAGAWAC